MGDLVYIPAPKVAFVPARVVSADRFGSDVEVEIENSLERHWVSRAILRPRFMREDGATSPDNTSLVYLNDASVLENLRARHAKGLLYTYTASVLLAVNPYKNVDGLYGEKQCARYRGKHIGALEPHPYAIADSAYRALVREQKNQGLLISGESGAGKTETAKIVMQFLAFASGAASNHSENIQSRVLHAQPILESFGNAVTMRNSNSSRFGKYNRVFFDQEGALVDAGITTYLLESSRVVTHSTSERTYHCFYEMLRGLDENKLSEFGLDRNHNYRLLTSGLADQLPGFEERDAGNFARLCDSLNSMGFDEVSIENMLKVLAGLIHLGNFEKSIADAVEDDDVVEVDQEAAKNAARLLGMDPDELVSRLTRKKIAVPGRCSFHEVPRPRSQFRHAFQSFIKVIYKRLFDRTVQRINDSFRDLRPASAIGCEGWHHIGILDIYGFEDIQTNSFEQLCINLANEKLQQYFVENVLRAEQDLYKREGLPWVGLPLPDAQPVCITISQVFKTLDEYSQNLTKGVGNATDKAFCMKVVDEACKDPIRKDVLRQLKMSGGSRKSIASGLSVNDGFSIKHYAGQVQYNTEGWLDKNNDRLLVECEALLCDSTDSLVQSLGEEDNKDSKGLLFRSISKKYQKDLENLLDTLKTCNLNYIRCFKPNGTQSPDLFMGQMVLDQVIQCGTVELVKIMHDGYPNRCPFEEITNRFRDLLPERFQRYGMRTFIEALMLAYDVPRKEWALGMSRLFLKAGQLRALENMRSEGAAPPADRLSEIVRGIIKNRWVRAGHAVSLCNYLPKYLAQAHLRRCEEALVAPSVLSIRLGECLLSARTRVEEHHLAVRRRLVGAFRAVSFLRTSFGQIRLKRRNRVATALRVAALLHMRTQHWVDGARERVAEEAKRKEAERRREEERRKREEEERRCLEEERRRLEEKRLQQERQRLELEKKLALEEQEKRRHEEEERHKKEAEESLRKAAELRREVEMQRDELQRQRDKERKDLEDERRGIQEERLQLEEERRLAAILTQASPHGRKINVVPPAEEVFGRRQSNSSGQGSSTNFEEDDMNMCDSISNISSLLPSHGSVDVDLRDTVHRLELEMESKHREIQERMVLLQEENRKLERQLHEERIRKQDSSMNDSTARSPSLIHLEESGALPMTPSSSPSKTRKKRVSKAPTHGSSRFSLQSSGRGSTKWAKRRQSAAHEALATDGVAADIGVQRAWWAEQRQYLLNDLYKTESPKKGGGVGQALRGGQTKMKQPTRFQWGGRRSLSESMG